jgi:hypothetical protein
LENGFEGLIIEGINYYEGEKCKIINPYDPYEPSEF